MERRQMNRGGRKARGQATVELALILPVLFAFLGLGVDFARMYRFWIDLNSATRSAAEYAATNDADSTTAGTDARRIVCLQVTGASSCASPTVSVTAFNLSTTAPGATTGHPVGSATVTASMPFRTLFPYPFFTKNGVWNLQSVGSYTIVQGR